MGQIDLCYFRFHSYYFVLRLLANILPYKCDYLSFWTISSRLHIFFVWVFSLEHLLKLCQEFLWIPDVDLLHAQEILLWIEFYHHRKDNKKTENLRFYPLPMDHLEGSPPT